MSSIAPVAATPPSIPVTPVKPVAPSATGPSSPLDKDGDHDNGAPDAKVSAAKAPGTGKILDIKV
jgi:hypothetical protein